MPSEDQLKDKAEQAGGDGAEKGKDMLDDAKGKAGEGADKAGDAARDAIDR